jgi:hypothetical protein
MPRPIELPDDIRPFSTRTAFELSDSRWEYDTSRFSGELAKVLIGAKDRRDPHEGR